MCIYYLCFDRCFAFILPISIINHCLWVLGASYYCNTTSRAFISCNCSYSCCQCVVWLAVEHNFQSCDWRYFQTYRGAITFVDHQTCESYRLCEYLLFRRTRYWWRLYSWFMYSNDILCDGTICRFLTLYFRSYLFFCQNFKYLYFLWVCAPLQEFGIKNVCKTTAAHL